MENSQYKVIGTRPLRHDGVDKVTGKAVYGADVSLPGLLYGKILRSPHAHARIRAIDTARAAAHPGVHGVITGRDLLRCAADRDEDRGEEAVRRKHLISAGLALDKVLYEGHALAAAAASSPHVAEAALELVEVDYEVLPPVLEVRRAMEEDAPLVHEDLETESLGEKSGKKSNVAQHSQMVLGEGEKGFAAAAVGTAACISSSGSSCWPGSVPCASTAPVAISLIESTPCWNR